MRFLRPMNWRLTALALSLAVSLALASQLFQPTTRPARGQRSPNVDRSEQQDSVRRSENYGKLPLQFELNQGQTDAQVRFLSRHRGSTLFLTANQAVLTWRTPSAPQRARTISQRRPDPRFDSGGVLRMTLPSGNPTPLVVGMDPLPGKVNYFIGNDPNKWRNNIATYAKVQYVDVYPRIDLVYHGRTGHLEYDFIVKPGGDPNVIAFDFEGADSVELTDQGDLLLHTAAGVLRQSKPIVYQETTPGRREVRGGYLITGEHSAGFQVAMYDRSRPLVIDPVLDYATYLAGADYDDGYGIAVDAEGSAYVTGNTTSIDFPTTADAYQTGPGGGMDAFVSKLNPEGSSVIYSTYLGGSREDRGRSIAVDADGNAYVAASTQSRDFPTTPNAFQRIHGGGDYLDDYDAFVAKLNPQGSALIYSTYLGGRFQDLAWGLAVDSDGYAYVTGETLSENFPTTPGVFQPRLAGGNDAFVTKLDRDGSALIYSTYLGGESPERGWGIGVDADGNAYVAGNTYSTSFPTTLGAFQRTRLGNEDAFITKLNPSGSGLVYSTYLGGSGGEEAQAVAVDLEGNVYVTGYTSSPDFPVSPGAFQTIFYGGFVDAFVTKLNPDGTELRYSTYLGRFGVDEGTGIAVDVTGQAYVVGATSCVDFPTTSDAFQFTHGGSLDAFLATFNPDGSDLVYSTFLGGRDTDYAQAIALDPTANVYMTGSTLSSNFPTTPGAFQTVFGGGFRHAFVAKFGN